MIRIALWGPIVPIGLACATLSSAIGSYLAAPRTLQAIAQDGVFPSAKANRLFARIDSRSQEPVPATILTAGIAFVFVLVGDVNFVAQIISMFFIITYGSICGSRRCSTSPPTPPTAPCSARAGTSRRWARSCRCG